MTALTIITIITIILGAKAVFAVVFWWAIVIAAIISNTGEGLIRLIKTNSRA